jgi:hypothetical protein
MNATQRTICAGLMLAVTACGATLRAEEPNREFALGVNAANATLRGGDVDGALKQYGEIRATAPESADLSYNMAVAQFRKGEVAAAAPLFEAAATSENDSLAANARYNLGNCKYTAGLKLAESDREAAIKELESAIENYRSSLSVDTNNADARANIELAAQLIDKLREEQKQQEQQQQNQQQDQDQQQSNDEQQNDQQQQSSQGKQDKQKQDQNQQQQENEQQQNQDQQSGQQQEQDQEKQENKDSQSQSSQDGEQQQKDQDQQQEQKAKEQQNSNEQKQNEQKQPQDQQQEQAKSQSQQNQTSQLQNSQKSQQQRPEGAGTPEEQTKDEQGQKPPQGDLSATNEEAKQGEEQREAVAFDPAKDGEMTQQEAEKMLQAIRDRDLIRRYNRQQNERQNYVPVDRDW